MKKQILILLCVLFLSSCSLGKKAVNTTPQERYIAMASLLENQEVFKEDATTFDLSAELVKAEEGYRYYVVLDAPREAMYNVRILAMEEGSDYHTTMAASVGVFEDKKYHLVPNQYNLQEGYVKGLSASGIAPHSEVTLRVMIRWENLDHTEIFREFYKMTVKADKS